MAVFAVSIDCAFVLSFLLVSTPVYALSLLFRRTTGCASDIYCSPQAGAQWIEDGVTTYKATWNTDNPTLKAAPNLIIELVDVAQPQSHLEQLVLPNNNGYAPFKLTDLDFGGANTNDNYRTKQVLIRIYAQGAAPGSLPLGPAFTIVQPGIHGQLPPKPTLPSSADSTATVTATATNVIQENTPSLSSHAILGISVAAGILGAALIALLLFFFIRRTKQRRKHISHPVNTPSLDPKQQGYQGLQTPDLTSMQAREFSVDSVVPLAPGMAPFQSATIHSTGVDSTSSLPLSTDEAIKIAATYRQLMRKPSWTDGKLLRPEDEEEVDSSIMSGIPPAHSPSSLSREAVATQLISRELADEGRNLSLVKRGSGVAVHAAVINNEETGIQLRHLRDPT